MQDGVQLVKQEREKRKNKPASQERVPVLPTSATQEGVSTDTATLLWSQQKQNSGEMASALLLQHLGKQV